MSGPQPAIRPLDATHLDDIITLDERCFVRHWSRELWEEELQDGRLYGAQDEQGAVIGLIGFRRAADEAEITRVCVDPAAQRHGLGSALCDFARTVLRAQGVTRLFIEVAEKNRGAQLFYHVYGFRLVGFRRDYYPPPHQDNALVMVIEL